MAWLPLYVADEDLTDLRDSLNEKPEIAFIVADGPGRWKAVAEQPSLPTGRYCLWHVESGPLPLLRSDAQTNEWITDPFRGWNEQRAGADPSQPYFGPGHPGVFWLNIRPDQFGKLSGVRSIGLSSFEWIGNHYRILGSAATPSTEKLWRSLGKWVKKHGVKVPRGGLTESTPPEIWALPRAHQLLESTAVGGNN